MREMTERTAKNVGVRASFDVVWGTLSFPTPPRRLPPFPVLAQRAWRNMAAHPRELLTVTFAFWTVFAVLDALHLATLTLLRARMVTALDIPSILSLRMALMAAPFNVLYLCAAAVLLLGAAFSAIILLRFGGTMQHVSDGLGKRFLPALRLCVLFALHSFLWVPLLGIAAGKFLFAEYGDLIIAVEMVGFVTFLSLAPRFALSPFFLAEGLGARESLLLSMERSRGYRWSIASGISLFLLPLGILLALLLFFLPEPSASAFFAILVETFLMMATLIVATAFYVQLGLAILSAPLLSTAEEHGNIKIATPAPEIFSGSRVADVGGNFHDFQEGLGLQGSPADEPAVNVGLAQ